VKNVVWTKIKSTKERLGIIKGASTLKIEVILFNQ